MSAIDLYLASQSPRRAELLMQLGLRFEIVPAEVVEQPRPGETPAQYALRIAQDKARAGATHARVALPVLGADTDVVLDGKVLGKPRDAAHAIDMLLALSGRMHEVYSAVALMLGERDETALSVTRVEFGDITRAQAQAYWDSGEPRGKAGAYAIQGLGARFVRRIEGSYSGVVGLPLYETMELLQRLQDHNKKP
ncbi:MAG TPA: nucleoside triphosphate pyrophosphatase [Nevskiaceae bacterium]|nr:nucleoside triphosphate pyrophosphatase [Nevskiaceae bacterium]